MLDGTINGAVFRAYIEQFLAPTLTPDNVVVADNLASHNVACMREAIAAGRGRTPLLALSRRCCVVEKASAFGKEATAPCCPE